MSTSKEVKWCPQHGYLAPCYKCGWGAPTEHEIRCDERDKVLEEVSRDTAGIVRSVISDVDTLMKKFPLRSMDIGLIIIDKFDNSSEDTITVGVCPTCERETLLVHDICSLCWEKKLGIEVVDGEVVDRKESSG